MRSILAVPLERWVSGAGIVGGKHDGTQTVGLQVFRQEGDEHAGVIPGPAGVVVGQDEQVYRVRHHRRVGKGPRPRQI